MKTVILDKNTFGDDLDVSALSDYGELEIYGSSSEKEILERTQDVDIIITNKCKLNAKTLSMAKRLKLICEFATGFDNIDIEYCRKNGIAVSNVVGYSTSSVAQITVGTVLSLYNKLPDYTEYVNSGEYTRSGVANRLVPQYREICGKTWGIVGYGNIGKAVGRAAEALGCRVIVYKKNSDSDKCRDIDTLCAESDIITVHLPLNNETKGIINEERIALMKKTVVLVNEARGSVWDERAVADAVLNGKIAALGCDVFSSEPFSEEHPFSKLCGMKNVILTPHMAWSAYEARLRCFNETLANINAFIDEERRNRLD